MIPVRSLLRKSAAAVTLTGAVAASVLLGQGTAHAGEGFVAPDYGVACALHRPTNNGVVRYRADYPSVSVKDGRSYCRYIVTTGGSATATSRNPSGQRVGVIPSAIIPISTVISTEQACQLSYGQTSHADGGLCDNIDYDHMFWAQREAMKRNSL